VKRKILSSQSRVADYLLVLPLIFVGIGLGLVVREVQYLPVVLLGLIVALTLIFVMKPSNYFIFLFSIGVPFSYSYSVFTREDPGSGLIWPRIIRDAIILLFLLNLILRAIHWKNSPLWNQRKNIPFILLLSYLAIRGAFSIGFPLSTFWVGIKYYLVLPVIGLLVSVAIKDRDTLRSALETFFSIALLIAFIGILEALADNAFVLRYKRGSFFGLGISRASSVWGNPLSLAGYLGLVIALWHPLQKHIPERFHGWRGYVLTIIFWLCLVLTLSRSSLLAIVASFGITLILLSQNRSNLIWGLLFLVALVPLINLITWFRTPSDVGSGFLGILPSNLRFKVWVSVAKQFLELPLHQALLGRGLGANSGVIHLGNIQALGAELVKTNSFPTDNFYLTLLFEIGLVGLVIFGFVCIAYLRAGIKLYQESEDIFSRSIYKAALIGINFFLIRNIFLQGMRTFLAGFYFWVLIGIMIAARNMDYFGITQADGDRRHK
jgi:O-antigen ligase